MHHRFAAATLVPMFLLSGCCTLSRLFCGPDDSRWVSISYDTPKDTVRTLLEAVRRDAPDVVHSCFSADFRRSNRLDSVTWQVAWERIKEQVTGLHLAGYAEVPEPSPVADDGVTFELDVEGHRLRIDLVRESFREVVYERPDAPDGESRVPLASWNDLARVETVEDPDFDKSRLVLRPIVFEHEGLPNVPLERIRRVGLIRQWKVSALQTPE